MGNTSAEHRYKEEIATWKSNRLELEKYLFIINGGIIYVVLQLLQLHTSGEVFILDKYKCFIIAVGFVSLVLIAVHIWTFKIGIKVNEFSIVSEQLGLDLENVKSLPKSEENLLHSDSLTSNKTKYDEDAKKLDRKLAILNDIVTIGTIINLVCTGIAIAIVS